ncbi:MAG: hypothetical protein ACO3VB_07785 [Opitutales bacterium]|jgi:hypothetical protein|nr:hypothetical protein [Verrucomicrobiota bacterium]MDA0905971.1 hypothetical protein [Verrucomicrobiota bacterium]
MKFLPLSNLSPMLLCFIAIALNGQNKPSNRPPNLPLNIPPPPSFSAGGNQNGKYQIVSGEYYSQDAKPFLYKRLIKVDTTTGDAWVLYSKIGPKGEIRQWIPLENAPK